MDGGILLVGLDVVYLAPIYALRLADGILQGVAPGLVVPDHAAHHPQLLGPDDLVIIGDDTGPGGHIDAVGLTAQAVKDQGIEHVDALGNDDGVLVALHFAPAAGVAGDEVVPGHLHLLAVRQAMDAIHQQIPVYAVGALPIGGLRRALVQGQEEIVHAQHAHLHAQVLQILLQAHGCGGLAGTGRTGESHDGLFILAGQNGGGGGADLIVKDLLAPEDELLLVAHGEINIIQVNDAHKTGTPFKNWRKTFNI